MESEQDLIREAMRVLGRRTSEKKAAAVRENGRKSQSEEVRAKMRVAQQARRQRERQAQSGDLAAQPAVTRGGSSPDWEEKGRL